MIDLTGLRSGKLLVQGREFVGRRSKWRCLCDCGQVRFHTITDLRKGKVISCGCAHRQPRFGGFCECKDHAWGILTRGYVTLVDVQDARLIQDHAWIANPKPNSVYAERREAGGKRLALHRVILNAEKGLDVDHQRHNGLDNRRRMIRVCTRSQNRLNLKKPRGVRQLKSGRWQASICNNYLGSFESEEEARLAYTVAASKILEMGALA